MNATLRCEAAPDSRVMFGVYDGDARCTPKVCGVPAESDFASVSLAPAVFPDVVTYSCKYGSTLSGKKGGNTSFSIGCQADGTFSTTTEKCKAIACGAVPVVKYAQGVSTRGDGQPAEWIFPMSMLYTCETGYTLDGYVNGINKFESMCSISGEFSIQHMNQDMCKPILCGPPPLLANTAAKSDNELRFMGTVEYACEEGYSLNDKDPSDNKFTSECTAAGIFSNLQVCKPLNCGTAPEVDHALAPSAEVFFPSQIDYSCEKGYTSNGKARGPEGFSVMCEADGKFGAVGECLGVSCGEPPAGSKSSTTKQGDVKYPDIISYECDDGYATKAEEGSPSWTLQCQFNGRFSGMQPCVNINDCVGHTCGPHGTCVDKLNNYTCDCDPGFEIRFVNDEYICGNIDDCGPEACGEGGKCKDLVQDYTCECFEGFELTTEERNEVELQANPVMTWWLGMSNTEDNGIPLTNEGEDAFNAKLAASPSKIVKRLCPKCASDHQEIYYKRTAPIGNFNAYKNFAYDWSSGNNVLGEHFQLYSTYEDAKAGTNPWKFCNYDDHSGVGAFRDCGPNGAAPWYQWNAIGGSGGPGTQRDGQAGRAAYYVEVEEELTGAIIDKVCKRVECGSVPVVEFASTPVSKAVFEDVVDYVCDEGYTLDGNASGPGEFTVECQASQEFTFVKTCRPVECGQPPGVVNAVVLANKIVYGMAATYTCAEGHTISGNVGDTASFSVQCLSSGSFAPRQSCKPISCGAPLSVRNGKLLNLAVSQQVLYGKTAEYKCLRGHATDPREYQNNRFTMKCSADGTFGGIKSCKPVVCNLPLKGSQAIEGISDTEKLFRGGQNPCGNFCGMTNVGFAANGKDKCDSSKGETSCSKTYAWDDWAGVVAACRWHKGKCTSINGGSWVYGCKDPSSYCQSNLLDISSTSQSEPEIPETQLGVVNFQAEVTFECLLGWTLNGRASGQTTFVGKCSAKGDLKNLATCRKVACGKPPTLSHATPTILGAPKMLFNDAVTYECEPGFAIVTTGGYPTHSSQLTTSFETKCLREGSFRRPLNV
jgi:hypothetical protein